MIFLLILFLTLQSKVHSKCNEINNYENGFPVGLQRLSDNDISGTPIILWHNTILNLVKRDQEYSSMSCETRLMKSGKVYLKYSLRPRGCCGICCLIDRIEDYLSFYVYGKNNTVSLIRFTKKKKAGTLADLGFRKDFKTILYLHSFSEDGFLSIYGRRINDAYLRKKEHFNVLSLDYSELVAVPWYLEAMDNVLLVAKAVSEFLIFYHKTGEIRIENIHMMGMSLGAQLASHIGKEVGKFKKAGRVTGLDPAFPIYPDDDPIRSIFKGDAEFVDIIHTSAGILIERKASGDADFFVVFPKGTVPRPGCDFLKAADRNEVEDYYFCDHVRSFRIYLQSITDPYKFPVCKKALNGSEVCGYIGYAADKGSTFGEYQFTPSPKWDPWEHFHNLG